MRTVEKPNPAIIPSVKTLTVETDADLNISSASEYLCYLLEVNNFTTFFSGFPEIFDACDRKAIKDVFLEIAKSYTPSSFLAKLPAFDGSFLLTQWIINPLIGHNDIDQPVIIGYQCIGCEIKYTIDQYKATLAETIRNGFRNTKDIIFIVDESCKIKFNTPGLEDFFYPETESWINKNGFDYLHEEDRERAREAFDSMLLNVNYTAHIDLRVRKQGSHKDEFIWMEFKGENKLADPSINGIVLSLRDVTEQVRSQQKLTNYSEQITSILNSITDGFVALDKNLTIRLWNKVAEQIVGLRPRDVLGKSLMNIFDNYHDTALHVAINKAIEANRSVGFEQYIEALDKWFDASAYPYNNGIFIYFKDITERKKQDMLLALEKEVLEMNTSKNTSLKITVDHFLLGLERINKGAHCTVVLLDTDRLHIRHLSSPAFPEAFSKQIDTLSIGPKVGSCGTAMYRREKVIVGDIATDPLWEGGAREFALSFNLRACWSIPIINARQQVLGSFACYYREPMLPTDAEINLFERATNLLQMIIENKKAEERIRITNERFLWATKATNEAIWDWDVKTNVLYWGEGFFQLFGYKSGYKVNTVDVWGDHIHPDDKEKVLKGIEDFMQQKKPGRWKDEYRFRKSDGKYAVVTDKGYLIYDEEGNMVRMVGATEDITERKQLERKLLNQQIAKQKIIAQAVVDAQEKERADIGKELHDNVNQILSTAKLFLEAAKTDAEDRLPLISKSAEHIHNAINEIRTISKALVPSSINDIGLIESVSDMVHNIASSKTIKVSFSQAGDIENKLNSQQKLMIFRIIQEQVNNVLKHALAKHLIIYLVSDKDSVYLEITDDGKGFDPDDINNKKGVGLSNIISRAELFNGKVSIVSSAGEGCKLEVKIPIKIS